MYRIVKGVDIVVVEVLLFMRRCDGSVAGERRANSILHLAPNIKLSSSCQTSDRYFHYFFTFIVLYPLGSLSPQLKKNCLRKYNLGISTSEDITLYLYEPAEKVSSDKFIDVSSRIQLMIEVSVNQSVNQSLKYLFVT